MGNHTSLSERETLGAPGAPNEFLHSPLWHPPHWGDNVPGGRVTSCALWASLWCQCKHIAMVSAMARLQNADTMARFFDESMMQKAS